MAAKEAGGQDKHALFEQWALAHKDYIYTACLYLTHNKEEAEDLFQETYLRAFCQGARARRGSICTHTPGTPFLACSSRSTFVR